MQQYTVQQDPSCMLHAMQCQRWQEVYAAQLVLLSSQGTSYTCFALPLISRVSWHEVNFFIWICWVMITAVVLCGRGFNLPASKVIHTVGPIYSSDEVSAEPLAKAYRYYFFESTIAWLLREAIIVLYRFVLCSFLLEATWLWTWLGKGN